MSGMFPEQGLSAAGCAQKPEKNKKKKKKKKGKETEKKKEEENNNKMEYVFKREYKGPSNALYEEL